MASTWPKATIVALTACAVLLAVGWQHGAASPLAVVDLASDDVTSHIFGVQVADKMGQSLAAGDFNDDGTDDILIGADEADGPSNGRTAAGEAYIIFGSPALAEVIDLATGAADVTIYGAEANDHLAEDVLATGDFNSDGFADALIAARYADGPANSRPDAGEVYLVFGSAGMGGVVDIASAQQDVTIYGADDGDRLAASIAVGDVNADGIDDMLLGNWEGDGPANDRSRGGEAYVIFGSPTLGGVIDLANGGADFTIYGERANDRLGYSVASGDFNADGTDDILATAPWAYGPDPPRFAGEAYVVFGSSGLSGVIDIASSQQDFTIYGIDSADYLASAAAGDLNGDGVDDILVVAWGGDGPLNARPTAGDAYAIFGPIAQGEVVDLALGEEDVTIYGVDSDDKLGEYVYLLTVGDFNGDGVDDILVGTPAADGPGNSRNLAGEAYVIFGRPTLGGTIDLASSEEIVTIYGAADGDKLGSVAAGDVNGDGVDEILVAAPYADGVAKSRLACGEAYVISLADSDDDGVADLVDNCPDDANADQADADSDSAGDVCDVCPDDPNDDVDGDGYCVGPRFNAPKVGGDDNCPTVANPAQEDVVHPGDGGDACEDYDSDTVIDADDNCPDDANPGQEDVVHPGDGGDVCEDYDSDTVVDAVDNCPDDANADQADADSDSAGDVCDVCPDDPNDDADGDGYCLGPRFNAPKVGGDDNCPTVANPGQEDFEPDGIGDECDDSDGDSLSQGPGAGFLRDAVELFIGTDPLDACADTDTPNDEIGAGESPWAPDFNDNGFIDIGDLVGLRDHWVYLGEPYGIRYDLNATGFCDIGDLVVLGYYWVGAGHDTCTVG